MTPAEILHDLTAIGVVVGIAPDDPCGLDVQGPASALTPERLALLRTHKTELLTLLAPKPIGCAWREDGNRVIFSDGRIYTWSDAGGLTLVEPHDLMTRDGTPMPEAWFRIGAYAPRRESFSEDSETRCHMGWWDYMNELHNRGLVLFNGMVRSAGVANKEIKP